MLRPFILFIMASVVHRASRKDDGRRHAGVVFKRPARGHPAESAQVRAEHHVGEPHARARAGPVVGVRPARDLNGARGVDVAARRRQKPRLERIRLEGRGLVKQVQVPPGVPRSRIESAWKKFVGTEPSFAEAKRWRFTSSINNLSTAARSKGGRATQDGLKSHGHRANSSVHASYTRGCIMRVPSSTIFGKEYTVD